MFKIGEFSRISQTPVTTLRYYDEMGLIKPVQVDASSGYRYYTLDQLPRLNRILALRDLGLSLEQIAQLLQGTLTPVQVRQMLDRKRQELCVRLREEQEQLARVEARLRQIEQEGRMSDYEVVLKRVDAVSVAGIREVLGKYNEVGRLFEELMGYLGRHGKTIAGPGIALWYDMEYKEKDVDGEAAAPIQGPLPESERVKLHELPAVETMACTLHKGSFDKLPEAYNGLLQWINANGYQVSGPGREVYLQMDPGASPDTYLTEVQFPVTKV